MQAESKALDGNGRPPDVERAIQTLADTYDLPFGMIAVGFSAAEALWWLTPREQQIAGYVMAGFSNEQAAEVLGISNETVKTHVGNIRMKLKAPSRVNSGHWLLYYAGWLMDCWAF